MNPISAFFALAARQRDIRRAFSLWQQVKAPVTELIDIVRDVGDDIGLLEQAKPSLSPSPVPVPLRRYTTEWIQENLNKLIGSSLKVDGDYGPATRQAVKEFQQAHPPLVVDGLAGVQTVAVMQQELVS